MRCSDAAVERLNVSLVSGSACIEAAIPHREPLYSFFLFFRNANYFFEANSICELDHKYIVGLNVYGSYEYFL